jgi:peptidoglycan/LPS O-acetylase OafA/YrhL
VAGSQDKPVEIRALSGARAFPPLLIILFHFSEGHHYTTLRWIDLIVARGYLWVEFFFTLSGFVLTHVYGARLAKLMTLDGFKEFLRARLTRLYPLHLFMLLALLVLMIAARMAAAAGGYESYYTAKYHPNMSGTGFVLSVFLVHAWNTMNGLTWNGASWFVSVEFALCLMFPLFAWFAKGSVWRGFVLVAAGVAALFALAFTSAHGLDITFRNGVLRGMAAFSAGVGMAVLYRNLKPRDAMPAWGHSLIQAGLLAALLYAFYNSGWSHTRRDIWPVLPMLALVLALAFDRGFLAAALQTRIPQMMGAWSYAVYMGQTFWLQMIRIFEQRLYPPPDTIVLGMRFADLIWGLEPALLVLVCIAWGALLAKFVEEPMAAWLKPAHKNPK